MSRFYNTTLRFSVFSPLLFPSWTRIIRWNYFWVLKRYFFVFVKDFFFWSYPSLFLPLWSFWMCFFTMWSFWVCFCLCHLDHRLSKVLCCALHCSACTCSCACTAPQCSSCASASASCVQAQCSALQLTSVHCDQQCTDDVPGSPPQCTDLAHQCKVLDNHRSSCNGESEKVGQSFVRFSD